MGAARTAAHRGACTLIVQAGALGGECTFLGCVLSKALIAAAARGDSFATALAGVRTAVGTIAATETDDVFRREGIDVVHGRAAFRSPREIDVDGRVLSARRFIVATGTEPAVPPIDGLKAVDYLTNENAFELESLPDSLVVLGGGAIGCELAQAFARLGSRVTVVEALDRLLPARSPTRRLPSLRRSRLRGLTCGLGRRCHRWRHWRKSGAVRLFLDDAITVTADRMLVATGRRARTAELGLEAAGVAIDRGFVVTDAGLARRLE